jgi:protocatechuate 3,4-dioxygenase beta subunit
VTLVLFLSLGAAGVGALQSAPSRDAQQTQGLGGVISGVVVDGSSGAPVAGAVVQIAAVPVRPLAGQTRQLTDERGRFAFTGLAGDLEYTLT